MYMKEPSSTSQVFFPVVGGESQSNYQGQQPPNEAGIVSGAPGEFVVCKHCQAQQQVGVHTT